MQSRLSRAVTAIGLGVSLWITSVAALAAPQPLDQTQGQSQPATSSTGQNEQKANTTAQSNGQQPAQTANKKPLSPNEDPTMSGKRTINKATWCHLASDAETHVRT